MTKKIIIVSLTIILLGILAVPNFVNATDPTLVNQQKENLGKIGEKSGYGSIVGLDSNNSSTISNKIGQIIAVVLAFLGVVFLVLVVFSGIQWMTAGGNEENVTKARTRLINATVGLAIVIAAYAITWFVVAKLQSSISPPSGSIQLASCYDINEESQCSNDNHCVWLVGNCRPFDQSCILRYPADCTYMGPFGNPCLIGYCQLSSGTNLCDCLE